MGRPPPRRSSRGPTRSAAWWVAAALLVAACDVADPSPSQRVAQGQHAAELPARTVSYGDHPRQVIELYPHRAGSRRGTLVFYHGGSFLFGSPAAVRNEGVVMAQRRRGWDVVSVGYRLRGDAPFPAQIHDAAAALRWLQAHGATNGLEVRRIVTVGSSAGGTLAALVGTISNDAAHLVRQVPRVHGWASFSGRANFSTADAAAVELRRGWLGNNPHHVHHASYLMWLDGADPPGYLAHGDSDDVVPVWNLHQVRQRALDHGFFANVEFDRVDRGADGQPLPLSCRRHQPQSCINATAFGAWLDRL